MSNGAILPSPLKGERIGRVANLLASRSSRGVAAVARGASTPLQASLVPCGTSFAILSPFRGEGLLTVLSCNVGFRLLASGDVSPCLLYRQSPSFPPGSRRQRKVTPWEHARPGGAVAKSRKSVVSRLARSRLHAKSHRVSRVVLRSTSLAGLAHRAGANVACPRPRPN